MKFYSLSSGSSGNCYYVGDHTSGILIDAGISAGAIRKMLKEIDIPVEAIKGILLTHYHRDHIGGVSLLARKHFLPVYTSRKVWESTEPRLKKSSAISVKLIELEQHFLIDQFEIEAFEVSHDAPETIGFQIGIKGQKLTIATDLGFISEKNASYLKEANVLVLESNYDEEMLMTGNYPAFLKSRIVSNQGHLDNRQASSFIAENLNANTRHICLAHLSKSNNSPEIALKTLQETLAKNGHADLNQPKLCVLNRSGLSEAIELFNH